MWSEMTIIHGYRNGALCEVDHIVDARIALFPSFIIELVLLSLMLFGVLRWKQDNMSGGIWQVVYTQVGISHPSEGQTEHTIRY